MKKLLIRLLRDIRHNIGQFISIVLILAVGSIMFGGMFGAILGLDRFVDNYYSEQNLADGWTYWKGISPEELEELKSENPNATLEGRYTSELLYTVGSNDTTLRLHSFSDINKPYLITGHMPKNNFEVILDEGYTKANNISIGQVLQIMVNNKNFKFTVTGICESPEYAYKAKDSTGGAANNRNFGIAFVTSDTLVELIRNSSDYNARKTDAKEKLTDSEGELAKGNDTLEQKKEDLSKKRREVNESFAITQKKLKESKHTLDKAQANLNKQSEKLTEEINKAQTSIDEAKNTINRSKTELDLQHQQYLAIRSFLSQQEQISKDAFFETQYKALYEKNNQILSQQKIIDQKKSDSIKKIAEGQKQIDEKFAAYQAGINKFEKKKADTNKKLDQADKDFNDAKQNYIDKQNQFIENKQKVEEELEQIPTYYQEVLVKTTDINALKASMEKNSKFVRFITREENISYTMLQNALDPIKVVSKIFPIIFFLVAAIITLIAMMKSVENDRTQIAVIKAIGVSKGKIRSVYIVYAVLASLLGSVGFTVIGNRFIPKLLLRSLTMRFSLPTVNVPIFFQLTVATFLIAFVFSVIAALIAVERVLKQSPAQGMRPRPPKKTKKILLERWTFLWKRLSYSTKLITRNIFLAKTRIILSSVGIIGSMMLLISGLSLQNSVNQVVDTTVKGMGYDVSVKYKDPVKDINSLVFSEPVDNIERTKTFRGSMHMNTDLDISLQLVEEKSKLIKLYDIHEQEIRFQKSSVVIPKSLADKYRIKVGDKIKFLYDKKIYEFTVSDIAVQYIGKTIYTSFTQAEFCGMDTETTALLMTTEKPNQLVSSLEKNDIVKSVDTKDNIIKRSKETINILNTLIFIISIAAGILAITVIYNITSINIFERTRELATLMVLGYYRKETEKLVFTENLILAGVGSVIGVPLGIILYRNLIQVISTGDLILPSLVSPLHVVFAVFLIVLFVVIANFLTKGKIKKIVMVEALKSVE